MPRPKPLSEKTLELNVLVNMLDDERRVFPSSFVYGFSLQYEASTGIDSTIESNVPGRSTIVALQFKRPRAVKNGEYVFQINNNRPRNNQHNLVRRLAVRAGRRGRFSVFYALPCFEDIDEVSMNSPAFASRTGLLDPYFIRPLNDHRPHDIYLDFARWRYSVRSETTEYSSEGLYTWEELRSNINQGLAGESVAYFLDSMTIPSDKERSEEMGPIEDSSAPMRALILSKRHRAESPSRDLGTRDFTLDRDPQVGAS